jgi:hypothetical protein
MQNENNMQNENIRLAQIAAWCLYIVADNYWQLADMYSQCGLIFKEYSNRFEQIRRNMWSAKIRIERKGLNQNDVAEIFSAAQEIEKQRSSFIDDLNEFLTLENITLPEN